MRWGLLSRAAIGVVVVATVVSSYPALRASAAPEPPPTTQVTPAVIDPECRANAWTTQEDNGIAVGEPKVFDNRSLALMLDSLNENLRTARFIDANRIAASIGRFSGLSQSEVARSLSLTGPSIPGTTQSTDLVTGATRTQTVGTEANTAQPAGTSSEKGTASSSDETTRTQTDKSSTTSAERVPAAPGLPDLLSGPAFTPDFGLNAQDLLAEQVNLTYQIFNLRMILERALSDRLFGQEPRLQAVLGFNVSLDPPRDAQGSAAIVEVTVSAWDKTVTKPVSLVAVMPQEKTYNAVNFSTKSNAFSGAAVSKVVNVGYNERRRSQTFYLYQDNDTLSFERMNEADGRTTTFGWQFRPVLGRPSVAPGMRQMFAVIALPAPDKTGDPKGMDLRVSVRTYWLKYYRDSATTARNIGFWPRAGRIASLGIAVKSPLKTVVDTSATTCVPIPVPSTTGYQDNLRPAIAELGWRAIDDTTAVVTAVGKNFFRASEVRIGGATHTESNGSLIFKSDQTFDVTVPIATLAQHDGVLVGRYGRTIPLELSTGVGVRIANIDLRPPLGGRYQVDVSLQSRASPGTLLVADLPADSAPVLTIDGVVVPPPYDLIDQPLAPHESEVVLRAYVPTELLKKVQGIVKVRFPLKGRVWSDARRIYDPDRVYSVERFREGQAAKPQETPPVPATPAVLLIRTDDVDLPFTTDWKVLLNTTYDVVPPPPATASGPPPATGSVVLLQPYLLQATLPVEVVAAHKKLMLRDESGVIHILDIPDAKPRPVEASIDANQSFTLSQFDAAKLVVTGVGLGKIAAVTADGHELEAHPADDGKSIDVYISGAVTKQGRTVTLVFRDQAGGVVGVATVKVTATTSRVQP